MVKEFKNLQMEIFIKVFMLMVSLVVLENIIGQMAVILKGTLKMG